MPAKTRIAARSSMALLHDPELENTSRAGSSLSYHRFAMKLPALCFAVLVTQLLSSAAWACSCFRPAPAACTGLGKDKVIFVGTVVGIENPPGEDPKVSDGGESRYHFRIDETFTKIAGSSIDVFSGRGGADCSYHFRPGRQYLLFLYKDEKSGKLWATICSDTRPIEEAKAILPQLRAIRDGKPVASLYGRLLRTQQPYGETQDNFFDQPLTKTSLRATSGSNSFVTKTDGDGVYALYGLPAGSYQITAALPSGLEIAETILSTPVPPVHLPDKACYEYDVSALPTGRISGQVFGPDGKPLHSASVELFRADNYKPSTKGWWEYQGEKRSSFQFLHVAPGDYILVFNNLNRLDPDAPFPRTFYSSSIDASRAQVIHLREGEQFLTADIHVSGGRPTRTLIAHVRWQGKKPDHDDVFVLAKGTEGDEPFAYPINTGTYKLSLFRDAQYALHASHLCQRCDDNGCGPAKEWRTPEVQVDGGDERATEVTLVFPSGGCQ